MTAGASHRNGAGHTATPLLDEPLVAAHCARGAFADAAAVLQLGQLATARSLHGQPLERQALAAMEWSTITRMPPGQTPADATLTSVLAAASSADVAVAFAIGADDGRPEVAIGIGGDDDTCAWLRRRLAPSILCASPLRTAPAALRGWSDRTAFTVLRRLHPAFAPAAAAAGSSPDMLPPSLLDALCSLTAPGWGVVLHARPLGNQVAVDHVEGLRAALRDAEPHLAVTTQLDEVRSSSRSDAAGARVRDWLELLVGHGEQARAAGAWSLEIHLSADTDRELAMLVGAVRGTVTTPMDGYGQWQSEALRVARDAPPIPSLASSRDIAELLRAPKASQSRLVVAPPLPAARVELDHERPLPLGRWAGVTDPARIDVSDLEGHAFVSGVTGSGKSTTVARLALGLWNAHQIPFLIVDPVKAEYAELASVMGNDLRVVSARDLVLNVLAPYPGADATTHLGEFASVFRGSFSLPSPTPYVLQQALDGLVDQAMTAPLPTLHDLRAEIAALVPDLGYRGEIEDNINASLRTRLSVLTSPSRAERLAASSNAALPELLATPTVVHLTDLGDDEERAFITGMLMVYVAQAARRRGRTPGVAHVTIVEEAHRILPEPRLSVDPEQGDPSAVTARFMTQLLAEIRAYGESLVIVDQSPAAVARDVLRNTNAKIVHRVVDPEDQKVLAGSIGLPDDAAPTIGGLATGQVLLTTRRLGEPHAAQVQLTRLNGSGTPAEPPAAPVRPCCDDPSAHHVAEHAADDATAAVFRQVLSADGTRLADRLATVQALHVGARTPCLAWVGLRRVLRATARQGQLRHREIDDELTRAFREFTRRGTIQELAETLQQRARRAPRPFGGCVSCAAPCEVRVFVGESLVGPLSAARAHVRRASAGGELSALSMSVGLIVDDVLADLGDRRTAAVAQCITSRVARAEHLPPALTVADLRAAGSADG